MKFTIGLPITKTTHLISTLESIKNQKFDDYEVIIRNNGRTAEIKKEIKQICKSFLERANVKYFESDIQLKMPENFNKILGLAEGHYFTVLSDDDVMQEEFLLKFDLLTKKYPETNVFHCRVKIIDENGKFLGITENCPEWETQEDFVYHRIKDIRLFFLSDFIVNTKELRKIGGFNEICSGWGLDEITWSVLGFNGIGYTPSISLNYRMYSGNYSLTMENLKTRFNDINLMYQNFNEIILKKCSDKNSQFPTDYMLKLNKTRLVEQNNLVLEQCSQISTPFETFRFYIANKGHFKIKNLFKLMIKKNPIYSYINF